MAAVVLLFGVWLFDYTGGVGLVRLYRNYLSQDIPDKKYSWQDFTDRGSREMLHGYYAGRDGNGFWMWTLSGLKRFEHQAGTSVYYYMDTCGIVRQLSEAVERGESIAREGVRYSETMTYSIDEWGEGVARGDYVWVKRVGEGAESKIIDKVWANSNQYYPVERLTKEQCAN